MSNDLASFLYVSVITRPLAEGMHMKKTMEKKSIRRPEDGLTDVEKKRIEKLVDSDIRIPPSIWRISITFKELDDPTVSISEDHRGMAMVLRNKLRKTGLGLRVVAGVDLGMTPNVYVWKVYVMPSEDDQLLTPKQKQCLSDHKIKHGKSCGVIEMSELDYITCRDELNDTEFNEILEDVLRREKRILEYLGSPEFHKEREKTVPTDRFMPTYDSYDFAPSIWWMSITTKEIDDSSVPMVKTNRNRAKAIKIALEKECPDLRIVIGLDKDRSPEVDIWMIYVIPPAKDRGITLEERKTLDKLGIAHTKFCGIVRTEDFKVVIAQIERYAKLSDRQEKLARKDTMKKPMSEEDFQIKYGRANEGNREYLGLACRECDVPDRQICPSCDWRYEKLARIERLLKGERNWNEFKATTLLKRLRKSIPSSSS
jgi:hypothetical protein